MKIRDVLHFLDGIQLDSVDVERPQRKLYPLYVVAVLSAVLFPLMWKPWIHGNDGVRHYAYCRSMWLDGDFDFSNEFEHYLGKGELEKMGVDQRTGLPVNSQGIGSALLWTPFFFVGHLVALVGPWAADGYSPPYAWLISFGTTFYAALGLLLLTHVLMWRFEEKSALFGILTIWLGTPLVFYMYLHPSMAHGCSFFLVSALIWMYERWRHIQRLRHFLLMGFVAGLMVVTRINNLVLLIIWATFWFRAWYLGMPDEDRYHEGRGLFWATLVTLGGISITVFPQLLAWRQFHDAWFSGPRDYRLGENLSLLQSPHFFKLFVSGHRGLFVWSPILFPALLGWIILLGKRRFLDWGMTVAFCVQVWVIGGWSYWYGGASFGQRFFLNFTPLFALGLVWLLLCLREGWPRKLLVVVSVLSVLWNFGLMVQYGGHLISREEPVRIRTLVRNQVVAVPVWMLKNLHVLAPGYRSEPVSPAE